MKAIKGGKKAEETLYANILLQYVQPFMSDVPDLEELEETLNVGLLAWNLAVIRQNDQKFYQEYSKKVLAETELSRASLQKLDKLMAHKQASYHTYNVVLMDCEIEAGKKGEVTIHVDAKTYSGFLSEVSASEEEAVALHRSSFAVLPRQPFVEWIKKTFQPGQLPARLLEDNSMYLIDPQQDQKSMEKWLRKHFEEVFVNELNEWTVDQAEWPKNRTYKMFCDWFDVKICSMIYDLGTSPIIKD